MSLLYNLYKVDIKEVFATYIFDNRAKVRQAVLLKWVKVFSQVFTVTKTVNGWKKENYLYAQYLVHGQQGSILMSSSHCASQTGISATCVRVDFSRETNGRLDSPVGSPHPASCKVHQAGTRHGIQFTERRSDINTSPREL